MQRRHPPATYLAAVIASTGERHVEFLTNELSHAETDLEIVAIVQVFEEMVYQRTYSPKDNKGLITIVENAIQRIKIEGWKSLATKMMSRIAGKG
jgi:repressor of nif and glnA expression